MKKTYTAPTARKIDYSYDEQIVAESTPQGVEARPYNPTYCQFLASVELCKTIVGTGFTCDTGVFSLR